ncbi:hypothetical protein NC653_033675 [Populus alba x Populus x berolinensis]|uniref:Uncharacterized protein n=1 Tax=Populus alba x Populus x berolinensis TaxID=444605 RepID=A0AAD6PZF1_9ROSI|nr:hypothetical protein NC653_033675 [Populus alba x Populus x berolinensis]
MKNSWLDTHSRIGAARGACFNKKEPVLVLFSVHEQALSVASMKSHGLLTFTTLWSGNDLKKITLLSLLFVRTLYQKPLVFSETPKELGDSSKQDVMYLPILLVVFIKLIIIIFFSFADDAGTLCSAAEWVSYRNLDKGLHFVLVLSQR